MKLIAVPAEAYDMARGDLFFAGAISVGWLVAGEWLATNVLMNTKPVWNDTTRYLGKVVGALGTWATLVSAGLDLKGSQKHRRLLGTGYLIFSGVMTQNWKMFRTVPKLIIPMHAFMGAFLWLTKPKA